MRDQLYVDYLGSKPTLRERIRAALRAFRVPRQHVTIHGAYLALHGSITWTEGTQLRLVDITTHDVVFDYENRIIRPGLSMEQPLENA
jgi:hypothetical protein